MKKNVWKWLASIFTLSMLAFGVSACGHEHNYAENWTFNETHHWHNSTCDCNVKVNYGEHSLDAYGVCTICEQPITATDGVIYDVSADGTSAEVIAYTGTAKKVKIADKYKNLPVTNIYDSAFKKAEITSIIVPDSVTSIGTSAFYNCSRLTSITIPDSVTSIGTYAFVRCYSLTSITIPDSVTSIGTYAFSDCVGLTRVEIGDSVTSIGTSAFYNCSRLTSITIPNSVTSIGTYAFQYCSSLTSITIPDSVTSIGNSAFSGCSSLTEITLPFVGGGKKTASDTYQYPFGYIFGTSSYTGGAAIKQYYYYGSNTSSTTYSTYYIPTSLKSVTISGGNLLYGAFYNCSRLTSITIPDSVTSIGNSAFEACDGLTSITIPDSVTSIGNSAFEDCDGLTRITIPDSVTSIGNYAFEGCSSLTRITIPDSVTSIGNGAFVRCYSLTRITVNENNATYKSLDGNLYSKDGKTLIQYAIGKTSTSFTIPDSVTSIGNSAFEACDGLTSITIPDSVTSIGTYAFFSCDKLTRVEIGDSVTSIGERAFSNCDGLTSITIPDSVTSIGNYAFYSCNKLTRVYYNGTAAEWSKISIGSDNLCCYYYSATEPALNSSCTAYNGNYWRYVNGVATAWVYGAE